MIAIALFLLETGRDGDFAADLGRHLQHFIRHRHERRGKRYAAAS
jgi:hypothetical protein